MSHFLGARKCQSLVGWNDHWRNSKSLATDKLQVFEFKHQHTVKGKGTIGYWFNVAALLECVASCCGWRRFTGRGVIPKGSGVQTTPEIPQMEQYLAAMGGLTLLCKT
eukprot:scaffold678_cov98-Cylindrotheca_fusiformis.AAC.5